VEERDEPIRTLTEIVAVDPDLAILVDAIELDSELLVLVGTGQVEAFSVPANTRRQISATLSGGFFFVKGTFDTPIVRQGHILPALVGEFSILRAWEVSS